MIRQKNCWDDASPGGQEMVFLSSASDGNRASVHESVVDATCFNSEEDGDRNLPQVWEAGRDPEKKKHAAVRN